MQQVVLLADSVVLRGDRLVLFAVLRLNVRQLASEVYSQLVELLLADCFTGIHSTDDRLLELLKHGLGEVSLFAHRLYLGGLRVGFFLLLVCLPIIHSGGATDDTYDGDHELTDLQC